MSDLAWANVDPAGYAATWHAVLARALLGTAEAIIDLAVPRVAQVASLRRSPAEPPG